MGSARFPSINRDRRNRGVKDSVISRKVSAARKRRIKQSQDSHSRAQEEERSVRWKARVASGGYGELRGVLAWALDCSGVVPWRLPCKFQPPRGMPEKQSAPLFQVGALMPSLYLLLSLAGLTSTSSTNRRGRHPKVRPRAACSALSAQCSELTLHIPHSPFRTPPPRTDCHETSGRGADDDNQHLLQ